MNRSHKLAWLVLGVVVVGAAGALALLLSSLYLPWEPIASTDPDGPNKLRHQRFPWLPGEDTEYGHASYHEWVVLILRPKP